MLYRFLFFAMLTCFAIHNTSAQVSISTNSSMPHATAMLDEQATDKGVLFPRMNTTARMAIPSPAEGLMVFDTDTKCFWYYSAPTWHAYGKPYSSIRDTDDTTSIHSEHSANDDHIRFFLGGTQKVLMRNNAQGQTILEYVFNNGNIFIGLNAGKENTIGLSNTALGNRSFNSNIEGSYNVALGESALKSSAYGHNNTALGSYSLESNTNGNNNTAAGAYAMNKNTVGGFNAAFGLNSLYNNSNGNYNTAVGAEALLFNGANNRSTAIGTYAMKYADNRLAGRNTLNTAVGYEAFSAFAAGGLKRLNVYGNEFPFEDLEPYRLLSNFTYSPQAHVLDSQTVSLLYGESYMMHSVSAGEFTSYQWYHNGVAIPGATNADYQIESFQPSDAGVYMAEMTNSELPLLTLRRNPVTILDGTTSTFELAHRSIAIYPNPATDQITINDLFGEKVRVYSAKGEMMYNGSANDRIDVSSWPLGEYFVVEPKSRGVGKFMKVQ